MLRISSGLEPLRMPVPSVTPSLVAAAYRYALRFGTFWRLKPEERAVLILSRSLRAIRSPTLREVILRILEKVWPERARVLRAFEIGARLLSYKIDLALRIGAFSVAETLVRTSHLFIPQLGYDYLNTPLFYRPRIRLDRDV